VPDQKIFCNSPWYELHIYWDGSLGICCQEDHKLYASDQHYNIATMTIKDWFNSEPVREFRQSLLGSDFVSACARCTQDEAHGANSRRIRNNQKSVIYTAAFDESFNQSPGHQKFITSIQDGYSESLPIDLHIDLGNYCNLACKMCSAQASSTIAVQQVKWGIESSRQYIGTDWTRNDQVWDNFLQQLLELPALNNIHFMGGETLLTNRFEQLVDFFIKHQRFEVSFSFVTNGTVFKPDLLHKLKQFHRVGIEVSIETVDEHNAYQRQGTDTTVTLHNIQQYQQQCNGTNITVSLRPATSALTIGYHVSLLQHALEHKLIIKSNQVYHPDFLNVSVLPRTVKNTYISRYQEFLDKLPTNTVTQDYNASDPNNYITVIQEHAQACVNALQAPDQTHLLPALVAHCQKWDQVYKYNAWELYPEWQNFLEQYGYTVAS
jgi:sulfatase maturation enzyme AslB (radical SAM superfamily)